MAFVGPNTQFKMTARAYRQSLFALGYNYIRVYNMARAYKLTSPVLGPFTALEEPVTVRSQL